MEVSVRHSSVYILNHRVDTVAMTTHMSSLQLLYVSLITQPAFVSLSSSPALSTLTALPIPTSVSLLTFASVLTKLSSCLHYDDLQYQ